MWLKLHGTGTKKFNPLLPSVLHMGRLAKILISIYERIFKFSTKFRDYESVGETAYLRLCPEKNEEKKNWDI